MAGSHTLTITEANFDELVMQSDVPVLVDFWAQWCAPCKALGPKIDELATEYAGRAKVGKVNVDENPSLTSRCAVSAFPTLLIYSQGQVQERIVGLRAKKDIADVLDQAITTR